MALKILLLWTDQELIICSIAGPRSCNFERHVISIIERYVISMIQNIMFHRHQILEMILRISQTNKDFEI